MPPVTPAPTPVLGLIALWSDRHPTEFSIHAPPCDAIGNSAADRVLAAAFRSVALDPSWDHQVEHLSSLVVLHTNRLHGTLIAQPWRREELRDWGRMVQTLSGWFFAVYHSRVPA